MAAEMPDVVETGRGRFLVDRRGTLEGFASAPLPPTLCFSDTHLVPRDLPWASDAPSDLVALIEAFPEHELLMLGDLTESIGVPPRDRRRFASSERLAPLFDAIAARRARIVIGNHDTRAVEFLENRFGKATIARGGWDH